MPQSVDQSVDQSVEPDQHEDQGVPNISTEVHSSDCTGQTDPAVYRIYPRTSRMELRLNPRPDDRTDRTGARLVRPSQKSKTDSRAKLSLGHEESVHSHFWSVWFIPTIVPSTLPPCSIRS